MAQDHDLEDTILEHLRIVAHAKRALLQVAIDVSDDYPVQGSTLVAVIKSLTRSADKLLGDTNVAPIPTKPRDPRSTS